MLRALFKSDIPQLLKIENEVSIAPWTEETFRMCFDAGYIGWGIAVEDEHELQGFTFISMHYDECHILNIAVTREFQNQGLGKKLLLEVLQQSLHLQAHIAYLEVRKTNARAIKLYETVGFQMVGERKDYYKTEAGLEDALIFAKLLIPLNPLSI